MRLGLGGMVRPDYRGSDDYSFMALPILTARNVYGFNFQPFALSFNLAEYTGEGGLWSVGFGPRVAYQFGRDQDDNAALAGLGDVDGSILPGGFVNARLGPVMASVEVGQDVADGHEGLVANVALNTFVPVTQDIVLIPKISATWADDTYMQSMFGVSAAQAATSAYAAYSPDAGFESVGAQVNTVYSINENWAANALLGYERLLGDAADSPLVSGQGRTSGSANQFSAVLGVSRSFSF